VAERMAGVGRLRQCGEKWVTGDHKLTALRHFAVRFADLD
jgi:hypothetical protein